MKPGKLLIRLLLILFLISCNDKETNEIKEPPEGCIRLSELKSKHDYYLPFALENDFNNLKTVVLNNKPADFPEGGFIDFPESGFYELVLKYNDISQPDDTILFTTTTEERDASEWGIKAWIPGAYKNVPLTNETLEIIYPERFTDQISIPFVFYVKESGILKEIYCQGKCIQTGETFTIKQGVGSISVEGTSFTEKAEFEIGGKKFSIPLTRVSQPDIVLNGTISTPIDIPANSLVRITGDLEIASTGSLTVKEGALLIIEEAADIRISGPVIFTGTTEDPVLLTSAGADKFWGGFITKVAGGTINASNTIFCRSGYHDTEDYEWGHAGRQALFYTENSSLTLSHCYITDHIGQIFYPTGASLVIDNILVQRAKTGGQVNNSVLVLKNSVFSDFPEESDVFADNDNDALYLNATDAVIEKTIFMYAGDDGLDSGAGEGGEITVTDCRFEACFHEGAALSSIDPAVKHHTFKQCIFTNCGQGLELGYSSASHVVNVDNCIFLANGVGIRYGDNYDWSEVNGKMTVRNSVSVLNDRDVWNMVRMTWTPKIENMTFENVKVSQICPQYPELEIINK